MPATRRPSDQASRPTSEPDPEPDPEPEPEPDPFLEALARLTPESDPPPSASAALAAGEGPPRRALPPDIAYEIRRAIIVASSIGLTSAASGWALSVSSDSSAIGVFAMVTVMGGLALLGALVNLVIGAPRWLRAMRWVRWLKRLDRALAAHPVSAVATFGPLRVELVGPSGCVAEVTPLRWGRMGYDAVCGALEGLTVMTGATGGLVVDGDARRAARLSPEAYRALESLLGTGARVEDGRVYGTCRLGTLIETLDRLLLLAKPGEGVEIPIADHTLVPVRTLAEGLPRHAALVALRFLSLGVAGAMLMRCNELERTTIWSRSIRDDAYGTALAAIAVAAVAVWFSRGAWTRLAQGADRLWWFVRTARDMQGRGLRLTRSDGRHLIYDPRQPQHVVQISQLDGQWRFAWPLRGLHRSTLVSGEGPTTIAGLRIFGDRVAAVIALTPELRALVLPLLAAGAEIHNGRIGGPVRQDEVLEQVLPFGDLFMTEAPEPFDRWAAARARMQADEAPVWRVACFEAALDARTDRMGQTMREAFESPHPDLQLAASALQERDDIDGMTRVESEAVGPLVKSLGDDGPAVIEAIAQMAARHAPADDARLIELGRACPAARHALVPAISSEACAVEGVFLDWLEDARAPLAVSVADALADWGTATALTGLEAAAQRLGGEPAERLLRAARAIRARSFVGLDGGLALVGVGGGELALAAGGHEGELALADAAARSGNAEW